LSSRGFTLVELLVGTLVMAVLGLALVRMLVSDSRFVSQQDAMVSARQTARAAVNAMVAELRMTGDSGLLAAESDSVRVRVPYAFGMTCDSTGGATLGALIPPDSLAYATAVPGGMAWRRYEGDYLAVSGVSITSSTDTATCTADSIRVFPGGVLISMTGFSAGNWPIVGRIFYLYQDVTYRFAASVELPGRTGLWRQADTAAAEELAAPFDSTASFAFLVGMDYSVQTSPPANLQEVRGLELRLIGASERAPEGRTEPEIFELVTRIPFLNRDE
jgi:prepilin-type N-terminal cleavage/methylation domain-containing protein